MGSIKEEVLSDSDDFDMDEILSEFAEDEKKYNVPQLSDSENELDSLVAEFAVESDSENDKPNELDSLVAEFAAKSDSEDDGPNELDSLIEEFAARSSSDDEDNVPHKSSAKVVLSSDDDEIDGLLEEFKEDLSIESNIVYKDESNLQTNVVHKEESNVKSNVEHEQESSVKSNVVRIKLETDTSYDVFENGFNSVVLLDNGAYFKSIVDIPEDVYFTSPIKKPQTSNCKSNESQVLSSSKETECDFDTNSTSSSENEPMNNIDLQKNLDKNDPLSLFRSRVKRMTLKTANNNFVDSKVTKSEPPEIVPLNNDVTCDIIISNCDNSKKVSTCNADFKVKSDETNFIPDDEETSSCDSLEKLITYDSDDSSNSIKCISKEKKSTLSKDEIINKISTFSNHLFDICNGFKSAISVPTKENIPATSDIPCLSAVQPEKAIQITEHVVLKDGNLKELLNCTSSYEQIIPDYKKRRLEIPDNDFDRKKTKYENELPFKDSNENCNLIPNVEQLNIHSKLKEMMPFDPTEKIQVSKKVIDSVALRILDKIIDENYHEQICAALVVEKQLTDKLKQLNSDIKNYQAMRKDFRSFQKAEFSSSTYEMVSTRTIGINVKIFKVESKRNKRLQVIPELNFSNSITSSNKEVSPKEHMVPSLGGNLWLKEAPSLLKDIPKEVSPKEHMVPSLGGNLWLIEAPSLLKDIPKEPLAKEKKEAPLLLKESIPMNKEPVVLLQKTDIAKELPPKEIKEKFSTCEELVLNGKKPVVLLPKIDIAKIKNDLKLSRDLLKSSSNLLRKSSFTKKMSHKEKKKEKRRLHKEKKRLLKKTGGQLDYYRKQLSGSVEEREAIVLEVVKEKAVEVTHEDESKKDEPKLKKGKKRKRTSSKKSKVKPDSDETKPKGHSAEKPADSNTTKKSKVKPDSDDETKAKRHSAEKPAESNTTKVHVSPQERRETRSQIKKMGKSLFSSIEDSNSTPPSQIEIENPILKCILDKKVSPIKIRISSKVEVPKILLNKPQLLPNGILEKEDEGDSDIDIVGIVSPQKIEKDNNQMKAPCPQSANTTNCISTIGNHLKYHTDKPYKCMTCSSCFCSKYNYRRHMLNLHSINFRNDEVTMNNVIEDAEEKVEENKKTVKEDKKTVKEDKKTLKENKKTLKEDKKTVKEDKKKKKNVQENKTENVIDVDMNQGVVGIDIKDGVLGVDTISKFPKDTKVLLPLDQFLQLLPQMSQLRTSSYSLPTSTVASPISPSNTFEPVPVQSAMSQDSGVHFQDHLHSSQFPRNEMMQHHTVPQEERYFGLPASSVASPISPSNIPGPFPCAMPQDSSILLRDGLFGSQYQRNEMMQHHTISPEARGPAALPVSSVASSIPPPSMFGSVPCSTPQHFSSTLRSYLSNSQFPRNEMVHHNTVPSGPRMTTPSNNSLAQNVINRFSHPAMNIDPRLSHPACSSFMHYHSPPSYQDHMVEMNNPGPLSLRCVAEPANNSVQLSNAQSTSPFTMYHPTNSITSPSTSINHPIPSIRFPPLPLFCPIPPRNTSLPFMENPLFYPNASASKCITTSTPSNTFNCPSSSARQPSKPVHSPTSSNDALFSLPHTQNQILHTSPQEPQSHHMLPKEHTIHLTPPSSYTGGNPFIPSLESSSLKQTAVVSPSIRTSIIPPLPKEPVYSDIYTNPLPSRPDLKVTTKGNDVILSWNLILNSTSVMSYQIYSCQQKGSTEEILTWKKIGDIASMPLPMACTLRHFENNNSYHFSVRTVDNSNRFGPFSEPASVQF